MKNFFKLSLVISFTLFASVVNANSWGLYVEALNEGGGQSNPLGGILLLVVTGLLLLFSWAIWGKRSIRYIYGPMILGWFVIFLLIENSDRLFSIRGIVFGLPLGLIFGWLIIGCLSLCGISTPFKSFPRMSESNKEKKNEKDVVFTDHSVPKTQANQETKIELHDKYLEARSRYIRCLEFGQLLDSINNNREVIDELRKLHELFTDLLYEGDGRVFLPYALLSKAVNENQTEAESRSNYVKAYKWYLDNMDIEDKDVWLDFGYLHDPLIVDYLQFYAVSSWLHKPDQNVRDFDSSSAAFYWYRKAASSGSRDAFFRCSVLVAKSIFIPKKILKDFNFKITTKPLYDLRNIREEYAIKDLKAAATMGHPEAQYELAWKNKSDPDLKGSVEFIALLGRAAYQNYLPAIRDLGLHYVDDKSNKENLHKAIIWFERCGADIDDNFMLVIATKLYENWGENTHSIKWLQIVSDKYPDGDDPFELGIFARNYIIKVQKSSVAVVVT